MASFSFAESLFHHMINVLLTSNHLLIQAVNGSKRLALIIGNSVYRENFLSLENSENDARAMEKKLTSLGFAVDNALSVDRGYFDMLSDIEEFTNRIREDATDIIFYYA